MRREIEQGGDPVRTIGEQGKEGIPVKMTGEQGRGGTRVKMKERTERGWKKEGPEVETEEKTGTDPEVMTGKKKVTERTEDKKGRNQIITCLVKCMLCTDSIKYFN